MPARLPDWPERLAELLAQRLRAAFVWGANDCALFAADNIQALTGLDPASHLRGQYHDEAAAQAVLAAEGGLRGLAEALLGAPMDNPALAQRGDVVCVALEGRDTLGVVTGAGRWAAPGARGLVYRPMSEVAVAWRV